MTAIIGVLNRASVALAADSAATVSDGFSGNSKVYNYANKIFNLSSSHPVGITIYNSSAFMGIPWETVIKMYRRELGIVSYSDLYEYASGFLAFIDTLKHNFTEVDSKNYLFYNNSVLLEELNSKVTDSILLQMSFEEFQKLPESEKLKGFNDALEDVLRHEIEDIKKLGTLSDFETYTLEIFKLQYEEGLLSIISNQFGSSTVSSSNINLLIELFYYYVIKPRFVGVYSGIIITGFGEKDIFPKLKSYYLGSIVDNKIRFAADEEVTISNNLTSAIKPFAQTDIISTFLRGIDPQLLTVVHNSLDTVFNHYNNELKQAVTNPSDHAEITKVIDASPKLINFVMNKIEEVCSITHENPIFSTIGNLSKEDLAEMAESLINLTYIKRRVSFTQESVGGPVDVAIITKGDGFVWIKRKLYFRPELNLNYLSGVLHNRNPRP